MLFGDTHNSAGVRDCGGREEGDDNDGRCCESGICSCHRTGADRVSRTEFGSERARERDGGFSPI